MYSAAKVDEFEMKDVCFQFMINVSSQGNNVKMKLYLKIILQRLQSSVFVKQMTTHQRSSNQSCPVRIDVLRKFAKFTGKHLCQRMFLNKVADLRLSKNTLFYRTPPSDCF